MSKEKNSAEIITLSPKDISDVQSRLMATSLSNEDKKNICAILNTYQWLYRQLQTAKLSINKLKSVFGFTTEKKSNLKSIKPQDEQPDTSGNNPDSLPKK